MKLKLNFFRFPVTVHKENYKERYRTLNDRRCRRRRRRYSIAPLSLPPLQLPHPSPPPPHPCPLPDHQPPPQHLRPQPPHRRLLLPPPFRRPLTRRPPLRPRPHSPQHLLPQHPHPSPAHSPHPLSAVPYFISLLRSATADHHSFPFALAACTAAGAAALGSQIHTLVFKNGIFPADHFVQTALLRLYAHLSIHHARRLFDKIPLRDAVHYDILMNGYLRCELAAAALHLFMEMLRFRIEPDAHIVTTALTACSHSGVLRQGIWIHRLLEREYSLFLRDIYVGTALVSMYAKCGCIEEAVRVFDGIPKRNTHVWSAMIGGFAMHGFAREAVGCLERMWDEDGLRVDGVVLLGALAACAHGGLVEEGLEIFAEADVGYGVVPVHEHYSSVVDMLCRVGRLEEAVGVIHGMPMRPRESVWGSLLTGCRNYGNVVLAEMAVGELEKLESGADEGIYVQLSNIYMNANKREEARRVRKMIGSKGIKKTTAYSMIVVDEEMSSFVAGDQVHPRRLEIFKILDWLMDHISDDYL